MGNRCQDSIQFLLLLRLPLLLDARYYDIDEQEIGFVISTARSSFRSGDWVAVRPSASVVILSPMDG